MPMTNRPSITDLARSKTEHLATANDLFEQGWHNTAQYYFDEAAMDEALILARLGELTA